MKILLGKIQDTKKHKKLLSRMVKGFRKDYANEGDNISPHSHNKIASAYMKGKGGLATFIVDGTTNAIVGYTILKEKTPFLDIDTVYILPEFRSKGYAKAVYEIILSNNKDVMITVSMRRAKEKNKFFRSLGFTNFMGDIGVDAEGREHIQIGEKGLCHLTTMGIIDNTVENISKWQEIADDRTLSSEQRDNRLMADMTINNTTNELEVA